MLLPYSIVLKESEVNALLSFFFFILNFSFSPFPTIFILILILYFDQFNKK